MKNHCISLLVFFLFVSTGFIGASNPQEDKYSSTDPILWRTYNVTVTVVVDDHCHEDVVTKTITVNPLPFPAFFAGLITDLKYMQDDVMSFKAQCVFFSLFNPIKIGRVIPYEEIWVSNEYRGYLGQKIIIGRFTVIFTEYP